MVKGIEVSLNSDEIGLILTFVETLFNCLKDDEDSLDPWIRQYYIMIISSLLGKLRAGVKKKGYELDERD